MKTLLASTTQPSSGTPQARGGDSNPPTLRSSPASSRTPSAPRGALSVSARCSPGARTASVARTFEQRCSGGGSVRNTAPASGWRTSFPKPDLNGVCRHSLAGVVGRGRRSCRYGKGAYSRQKSERNHPGSGLSCISGSAIKRITAVAFGKAWKRRN